MASFIRFEEDRLLTGTVRPLTARMGAALDRHSRTLGRGAIYFVPLLALLALIVGWFSQRSLAIAFATSLLAALAAALIGGSLWFAFARRHRAARAAGTYRHYAGPVTIKAEYRRNRTIWRVVIEGTTSTLEADPAVQDRGWFSAGQATGTFLYSPEARYLFATWAADGRLVYRAREYELDTDLAPA